MLRLARMRSLWADRPLASVAVVLIGFALMAPPAMAGTLTLKLVDDPGFTGGAEIPGLTPAGAYGAVSITDMTANQHCTCPIGFGAQEFHPGQTECRCSHTGARM